MTLARSEPAAACPPSSSFPPSSGSLNFSSFTLATIRNPPPAQLTRDAADARPARPGLAARASDSAARPRPRRSILSKSSSAVPTLSTATSHHSSQRLLPTHWLPTAMTTAGGASSTTAADLLRQAMMQR
ncbi:hypothetical protein K505DRAFT_328894 [Melanomma pulvis-pyrius CBS 109.77]|uniref:Uncharacterized protein n=1 Tax=Melanomma pulvis-pyrius CBS 109.77 TaxID=1314802 RepID=A0A6A6WWJ2_9PLEO|nr:hypothetical protein K505DRAFT_328894 [Melanomma pulvis-pyrius CBS 109.77]